MADQELGHNLRAIRASLRQTGSSPPSAAHSSLPSRAAYTEASLVTGTRKGRQDMYVAHGLNKEQPVGHNAFLGDSPLGKFGNGFLQENPPFS